MSVQAAETRLNLMGLEAQFNTVHFQVSQFCAKLMARTPKKSHMTVLSSREEKPTRRGPQAEKIITCHRLSQHTYDSLVSYVFTFIFTITLICYIQ